MNLQSQYCSDRFALDEPPRRPPRPACMTFVACHGPVPKVDDDVDRLQCDRRRVSVWEGFWHRTFLPYM